MAGGFVVADVATKTMRTSWMTDCIPRSHTKSSVSGGGGGAVIEWTRNVEIRKGEFPGSIRSMEGYIWPTPGFKEKTVDSSGLGLCAIAFLQGVRWIRDSSVGRAPDYWPKGCEFKFQQERWETLVPKTKTSVLTLIRCPFQPRVTAVARKDPGPFS